MDQQTIERNFTYHAPKPGQPETYEEIRSAAKTLAHLINHTAPDSREKSLAMTKLEEAVFWTNAAIARTGCLLLMLFSCVSAQGKALADGLDEVNLQRSRIGLPAYVRDARLCEFAQMKAEWQAARRICVWNGNNGHEGPRFGEVGVTEGTGVTRPHNTQGWLSCAADKIGTWQAGAGCAYDSSGNRYNCLLVRCPNGLRESRRTPEYLIPTYQLTPDAPVILRDGSRRGMIRAAVRSAGRVCRSCGKVH